MIYKSERSSPLVELTTTGDFPPFIVMSQKAPIRVVIVKQKVLQTKLCGLLTFPLFHNQPNKPSLNFICNVSMY